MSLFYKLSFLVLVHCPFLKQNHLCLSMVSILSQNSASLDLSISISFASCQQMIRFLLLPPPLLINVFPSLKDFQPFLMLSMLHHLGVYLLYLRNKGVSKKTVGIFAWIREEPSLKESSKMQPKHFKNKKKMLDMKIYEIFYLTMYSKQYTSI